MISIKILSKPAAIEKLKQRGPAIIEALTAKMSELMSRLQSKIVTEKLPAMFKASPNIAASIQAQPTTIQGTKILGTVKGGGIPAVQHTTLRSGVTYDIAVLQEGGVPHGWEILPFTKKALAFQLDGKQFILRRVFHPPLVSRPFMRESLHEMEAQITSELKTALQETLDV